MRSRPQPLGDPPRVRAAAPSSPTIRLRSCGDDACVPPLTIPQPYDFEISTERFRAFGPDLANLWHEGGLHRVVDGREVRIEAAPGGVLVEPFDERTEVEISRLLGLPFDLDAFYRSATDPVVRHLVSQLSGFRPPLAPDPFESLVTSIT